MIEVVILLCVIIYVFNHVLSEQFKEGKECQEVNYERGLQVVAGNSCELSIVLACRGNTVFGKKYYKYVQTEKILLKHLPKDDQILVCLAGIVMVSTGKDSHM